MGEVMKLATRSQLIILKIIKDYIKENEIPPTIREICDIAGLKSTSTVHMHLKQLENQGYIYKKEKSSRSIRLTGKM